MDKNSKNSFRKKINYAKYVAVAILAFSIVSCGGGGGGGGSTIGSSTPVISTATQIQLIREIV